MKTNFKMMLLVMAALGIFGCSDKLTDTTSGQGQEKTDEGFVAFQINNIGSGTRSTGLPDGERDGAEQEDPDKRYEEGTADENAISSEQGGNAAFFFKTNGEFLDKSYLQVTDDNTATTTEDKNKVYRARIRRDANDNDNTSYYCVLILNAKTEALEALSNKNLPDFMAAIATKTGNEQLGRNGKYFTMSNTVYVEEDKDNTLHGPQEIPGDKIYKTWNEAQDHPITIRVERVVAKFGLTFKDNNDTNLLENNNVMVIGENADAETLKKTGLYVRTTDGKAEASKWAIRINNWDVNGQETKTYWTKNLSDGQNIIGTYPDAKLNKKQFGSWGLTYNSTDDTHTFGWNDQSRYRSYWAVDPHYNDADNTGENAYTYPRQYRNAVDNTSLESYTNTQNHALTYISYEEIKGELDGVRYAPENTFGAYGWFGTEAPSYDFSGDTYRWTSTHILVAAQLLLGKEIDEARGTTNREETATEEGIDDKYCFEGVYWTGKDVGTNQVALIKEMVQAMCSLYGSPLYKDKNGTPFNPATSTDATDYFKLVPATIQGGDGRLMLSLKDNQKLYHKETKEGNDGEVTELFDEADLTETIYQCTVQHFKNGKMYYAIPIEHLVDIQKKDGKTTAFNIGSYGVVRNHWYKVNISAIKNPGTPVDDPNQKIVPGDEPKEVNYIAFQIVVLPWHVIEQDVEF